MNLEKLSELLYNLEFKCSISCNTTIFDCKCHHTIKSRLNCSKLKEISYTFETNNGKYTVYLMPNKFNFIHIDFVLKNGASENSFVNLDDVLTKFNSYSELKTLIRKNKIDKIVKMCDDILIEKHLKDYIDLLNFVGFKKVFSNPLYRDIYILNYNNKDYTVIINNDNENSGYDRIESKHFDNATQSRGGANWRNHPDNIKKCISWAKKDFDTLIKSLKRKNKINKII